VKTYVSEVDQTFYLMIPQELNIGTYIVGVDGVEFDGGNGGFRCSRPMQLQAPIFSSFAVLGRGDVLVLVSDFIRRCPCVPDTKLSVFI
jgi:hypothetical protein